MQGRAKSAAALAAALLLAATLGVRPAAAEEPGQPSGVPIDRLLKLPQSLPVKGEIERRGGATRGEWQARFTAAHEQLANAKKALAQTRAALREKVGDDASSWKMSAPGLGSVAAQPAGEAGPVDYKLSQDLKRQRDDVEHAQKQLQDLEVEANLAGVPAEWRGAEEGAKAAPHSAAGGS